MMHTPMRDLLYWIEVERSRPQRVEFAALGLSIVAALGTLVLLGVGLSLIAGGLMLSRPMFLAGLMFMAVALACPIVVGLVVYGLLRGRRWGLVAAILLGLVVPALDGTRLAGPVLAAGRPAALNGFEFAFHGTAALSILCVVLLLSPTTIRWIVRAGRAVPS